MEKNKKNFITLFVVASISLLLVFWLAIFGLKPRRVEINPETAQMCGGIANIQCSGGQKCLIAEDYPDASGICVAK